MTDITIEFLKEKIMNNRFKFRVWDKEHKYMFYPKDEYDCIEIDANGDLHGYGGNGLWVGGLNCISMQCTGQKDKNSTLIYEGDIVRFYDDTICIIKWDDESGMFCTLDTEGQAMIGVPEYYEVLGNIYENPELAKEIKETRKNKEEKNNG